MHVWNQTINLIVYSAKWCVAENDLQLSESGSESDD